MSLYDDIMARIAGRFPTPPADPRPSLPPLPGMEAPTPGADRWTG